MKTTFEEPSSRALIAELRASHLVSMSMLQSMPTINPAHGIEAKHDAFTKRRLIVILNEALALLDDDKESAFVDSP